MTVNFPSTNTVWNSTFMPSAQNEREITGAILICCDNTRKRRADRRRENMPPPWRDAGGRTLEGSRVSRYLPPLAPLNPFGDTDVTFHRYRCMFLCFPAQKVRAKVSKRSSNKIKRKSKNVSFKKAKRIETH